MAGQRRKLMFFGGIGTAGHYIEDITRAFTDIGGFDAEVGGKGCLTGRFADSLLDQLLQCLLVFRYRGRKRALGDGQKSYIDRDIDILAGYSYGGLIAAQIALHRVRTDDLVLIACPIGRSLLDALTEHAGVGRVHCLDLTSFGDPIHAGQSTPALLRAIPRLPYQFPGYRGHFHYAQPAPEGRHRHMELAISVAELIKARDT